jgi:hypothetical protein
MENDNNIKDQGQDLVQGQQGQGQQGQGQGPGQGQGQVPDNNLNNFNNYNSYNYDYNNINKKQMSALKIVGIVLLAVFGVPLILFGVCILLINSSF